MATRWQAFTASSRDRLASAQRMSTILRRLRLPYKAERRSEPRKFAQPASEKRVVGLSISRKSKDASSFSFLCVATEGSARSSSPFSDRSLKKCFAA